MREFITFHPISFNKENVGIKKLFGLNTNIEIGIQQFSGVFFRNPKNANQIEIPEKIEINETEYNKFTNSLEAFEVVKSFVYNEFKLDDENLLKQNKKEQTKNLYFYIFENNFDDEKPKFRGVFYATISTMKPAYFVAFTKSLEYEYDKEIYKK